MAGPMNQNSVGAVVKEAMTGKKKKDDNLPKKPGSKPTGRMGMFGGKNGK